MLSLQWNLNNVYMRFIGMNLYKYLFKFKIEVFIDRLTMFQVLENLLEHRFIKEHLRKDAYTTMNKVNTFVKCYYNFKYHWEKFEVNDEV